MDGKDKYNVVDGQQRITCNYKAITDHEEFKSIVLDLGKGKFVDIKEEMPKKTQIPVGILYNRDFDVLVDYLEKIELTDFKIMQLLTQIRTKFYNYDYIINNAHDLSFEEQIEWFNVLNLAGSTVPDVQMKLTNLQVKGIDFYEEYARVFCGKLNNKFEGILTVKTTEVSIPLACLNAAYEVVNKESHRANYSPIPSDQKIKEIYSSKKEDIKNYFELTLNNLDKALKFIEDNNLETPDRIDSITYLCGFFVWNQERELTEKRKEKLINWYKEISFSNKSNGERREEFSALVNLALKSK